MIFRTPRRILLCFAVLIFASLASVASAQTTRPVDGADRIVIISIDGCRPDVLLRADCPAVRSLMRSEIRLMPATSYGPQQPIWRHKASMS